VNHHQCTRNSDDDIILCWARGKRRPHRSRNPKNSFREITSSSDDILAYEKSLIINRDTVSYILGSDETGTGAICGPVITATCCILQLKDYVYSNNEANNDIHDEILSFFTDNENNDYVRIKDSKQILPEERERIYQIIIDNPQIYAFAIAQRSNIEIDETNNIVTTTMSCFTDSIESLAQNQLIPLIQRQQHHHQTNHDETHDSELQSTTKPQNDESTTSSPFYSIVDGKKSPKLTMDIPCRPMVKADSRVVTVALASIIAKVVRDRMAAEWHEQYPQYGFDHHKGYATRQHIEAIHRYGPCPLHRMTFKSLQGR
jgi:ribonuclease HII